MDAPTDSYEGLDDAPEPHRNGNGVAVDAKPKKPKRTPPAQPAAAPFRFLGHDRGVYYYLPRHGGQIIDLPAASHTRLHLLQLAPLSYWSVNFVSEDGKTWWDGAADTCIQKSLSVGIFDPEIKRGRGAWLDDGRVVFHVGKRLVVDGIMTEISDHATSFVYEQRQAISIDDVQPASAEQGQQLLRVFEKIAWRKKLMSRLAAGWCFIAPLTGMLKWRPSIWITGLSGAGKGYVVTMVKDLVGDSKFEFAGNTTEPAIRSRIGSDALPCVFDEAESNSTAGLARMQAIMEFIRAGTSGDIPIVKGKASGGFTEYHNRCMFLLASIGVAATDYADLSRITPLEIMKLDESTDEARKADCEAARLALFADDAFAASIRVRALRMVKTILENAKIFKKVVARKMGDSRFGDQLGTLIAGCCGLTSDAVFTEARAQAWVDAQDWDEYQATEEDLEQGKVLQFLRGQQATMLPVGKFATIGGLIHECMMEMDRNRDDKSYVMDPAASEHLRNHGIKINHECEVLIANPSHPWLGKKVFAYTEWGKKYNQSLLRIKGAVKTPPEDFCKGRGSYRCTKLPREAFE